MGYQSAPQVVVVLVAGSGSVRAKVRWDCVVFAADAGVVVLEGECEDRFVRRRFAAVSWATMGGVRVRRDRPRRMVVVWKGIVND